MSSLLLLPLAWGAVAACGGDESLSAPRRFWSMAELQREAHLGPSGCSNPAGLECDYFVKQRPGNSDVLQMKVAFAEGQPMAYITTDFWANYDAIVLQPMYFLVTVWDQNEPKMNRLTTADGALAGPIFSVGPQSAFYSPFWSVFYVVVPPGTAAGKYTSARQLFDDHLEMHQGSNRFASIGPDGAAGVALPDAAEMVVQYPNLQDYLKPGTSPAEIFAASSRLSGWLDGAPVSYVDFGTDNFTVDATQLVQDVPLFVFRKRGDAGALISFGAPNVGGVGPLFTHAAPNLTGKGRPQFGALWRLYIVTVPASAGVYPPANVPVGVGLENKVMRVALNADTCFGSLAPLSDTCQWLDSQAAIEKYVGPGGITRTPLEPACPFVMFDGVPVPNP